MELVPMISSIGASSYNVASAYSVPSANAVSAANTANTANQRGAANLSLPNDGDMAAGRPESSLARSSQIFNYNTEREALNILA
jgi:hypothetical protein